VRGRLRESLIFRLTPPQKNSEEKSWDEKRGVNGAGSEKDKSRDVFHFVGGLSGLWLKCAGISGDWVAGSVVVFFSALHFYAEERSLGGAEGFTPSTHGRSDEASIRYESFTLGS
jgi:hypothetical protein